MRVGPAGTGHSGKHEVFFSATSASSSLLHQTMANHPKPDPLDFDVMMESIHKAGFIKNEKILQYSFFKGPEIKDDVWDDVYASLFIVNKDWAYMHDKKKKIERHLNYVHIQLINHGYDDFYLLVPIPLLYEYIVLVLNGVKIEIGDLLLQRIRDEGVNLEEVREYYYKLKAKIPEPIQKKKFKKK